MMAMSQSSAVENFFAAFARPSKAAPREPITAKLVADLLEVSGIDNIITVDLHQDAIRRSRRWRTSRA